MQINAPQNMPQDNLYLTQTRAPQHQILSCDMLCLMSLISDLYPETDACKSYLMLKIYKNFIDSTSDELRLQVASDVVLDLNLKSQAFNYYA